MLNHEMNSNPVEPSSTFMGTLQNKLKDIKNFSNWSTKEQMVAVTAVGVIFGALLPVVAVALPVAAAGAAVALTLFFAVKAVEYGYKGLKWSAEKTWEGAKRVGGKIKAGYEHSVDSLKRGAHRVNKRTKEKASDMFEATAARLYRAAGNENYLDRIDDELVPNSPQKEKFREIREELKAIFASGEDNSKLVKSILSGISSKIEEKIKAREKEEFTRSISVDNSVENVGLTLKWERQKKFVDDLSVGKLQSLVTQRSLDKDSYFIRSIFSEHHSEIKEVIEERKIEHKLSESLENLNKVARKHGRKVSPTQSTLPSLSRSSSMSSLNSNSTDGSTAGLLNSGEHKKAPTFKNKMSSLFRRNKAPKEAKEATEVKYQVLPGPDGAMPSATVDPTHFRRNSSSSSLYDGPPVLTPAAPPKAPKSPTSSRDSGRGSSPSTPERQSLPVKTLIEHFNTSPLTGRVQHTK